MAKIIVFDFDGTIADSYLDMLEVVYELVHHRKLPKEDISRLRSMSLLRLMRELGVPLWRMPFLSSPIRRGLRERMNNIALAPGLGSVVRKLSKSYKLFVLSTNSVQNVRIFLQRFGLEACFVDVFGNVGVFQKARFLRRLVAEQQVSTVDVWYVGDEARDVKAARHAGVKSMAVTWGYGNIRQLKKQNPDALVLDQDDLARCFSNN